MTSKAIQHQSHTDLSYFEAMYSLSSCCHDLEGVPGHYLVLWHARGPVTSGCASALLELYLQVRGQMVCVSEHARNAMNQGFWEDNYSIAR